MTPIRRSIPPPFAVLLLAAGARPAGARSNALQVPPAPSSVVPPRPARAGSTGASGVAAAAATELALPILHPAVAGLFGFVRPPGLLLAAAFALPLLAILALDLARQLRTRGAGASTA